MRNLMVQAINPEQLLEDVQLRYVSTDSRGYTRKPWGRGFTYQDADGQTITDKNLREWIESIVIPPAWTEVWISPHKNGHILATGRDDAGRKQYRYHPRWNDFRSRHKFNELARFGKALPHLRETVQMHLRKRKLSREKVLATVVTLLEKTLIRIGNADYARKNDSYGLSTLEDDHVEINGSTIVFDFVGKHGKEHEIDFKDKRLAKVVKACRDIPGYELFQYYDEDGNHNAIDSSDVNAYIKEITGEDFTAKVFRTWGASTLAIRILCDNLPDDLAISDHSKHCIECVAESLGNTIAVCRDHYIHPIIFEAYEDGNLCEQYAKIDLAKDANALQAEEQCLVNLIQDVTK